MAGKGKSGWDVKYPDSKIRATAEAIAKAAAIRQGGGGKSGGGK